MDQIFQNLVKEKRGICDFQSTAAVQILGVTPSRQARSVILADKASVSSPIVL